METVNYSIIKKSQLEGAARLDAEYYQPVFLDVSKKLQKIKTIKLGEFCKITDGDHAKIPGFVDSDGKRYLRAKDLQEFFIDDSDPVYVGEEYFNRLKRSHIKPLDIVLSIMGTVGNIAVIPQKRDIMTANRAVGIISPKNQEIFSSYFLVTYLKSKFGCLQRERESMGGVQLRVNLDDLTNIKIPVFSKVSQNKVDEIFNKAVLQNENSKLFYRQAEKLLFEELGLNAFSDNEKIFSIVNLSEINSAHRIDAEFFQGKNEQIIKIVEVYKGGFKYLENLTVFINNGNQPPYSEKGEIKFFSQKWIKDKEIDYAFLIDEEEPRVSKSFFEDKKNSVYLIKKNDILYYSVGANLGYCHNYLENENIAIGSFINLIRADEKKINPIYLGIVLNSVIGRMQSDRDKSGLAQPYIYAKNLRKFKIPILPIETQKKISELVIAAHEARKKSKELLEQAKRKVEEMIEKGGDSND